jgi:isohexenylglutaconyl-CoA hydratase
MGGGLGLACVVDVALAGQGAQLRLPETSLGVVPAQIAAFLVERVGPSQARRLAVTGGRLDAAQALAIGLVHEVHPDGAALEAALAATLAQALRCAPGAIAATKALMARVSHTPAADLVDDAARVFAQAARGAEGVEGMTAFLQKRLPAWAPQ